MTQEEFGAILSFASLLDDNKTILINGNPEYSVKLPSGISKKNAIDKQKIIYTLILNFCNARNVDYVSLQNVRGIAKEVVAQIHERARLAEKIKEDKTGALLDTLSVSDALRKHSGKVKTFAMIVGVSQPYKLISSVEYGCNNCDNQGEINMNPPTSSFNKLSEQQTTCQFCKDGKNTITKKQYVNAKSISIQDSELGNNQNNEDLEKLHVIMLGDDMTRNVRVGEMASIVGDVYVLGSGTHNNKDTGKMFAILFADSVRYQREIESPITEQDIEEFKKFAAQPDVIDKLVEQFAPNVIGHSDAKQGILRSAVNAKSDVRRILRDKDGNFMKLIGIRNRLHTLLAGDPGTAKTMLAQEAVQIVPNSRFVTIQQASMKSMMAIIDKEQDSKMLLLGPVPMSKNALVGIDDVGSSDYEDQQHLGNTMEEGRFTIAKHGIYQEIDSPTTMILTTNPKNGIWDTAYTGGPSLDQIPIKSNILDRVDQFYIFENFQTAEDRREYAERKMEINQAGGVVCDYTFLKKYLQYAATAIKDPVLTPEAGTMLTDLWMRLSDIGNGGNRRLDTLVRIAKAQAKLHLKEEIDVEIANEVITSIGMMYVRLGRRLDTSVADPRDLAFNEIIAYVNTLDFPITFEMAIKHICDNNSVVKQYVGGGYSSSWTIRENRKLRAIHDRFTDNSSTGTIKMGKGGLAVSIVQLSPLTLVKAPKQEQQQEEQGQGQQSTLITTTPSQESDKSLRALKSPNDDNNVKESSDITNHSSTSDLSDSSALPKNVGELLQKCMKDEFGNNLDYFDTAGFKTKLICLPVQHPMFCEENQAEQMLQALIDDGKIVEIGKSGSGKFQPVEGA
jgi:replicative DNA helicase Mcm